MNRSSTKPLFPLGRWLITPGARDELAKAHQSPLELLRRHQHGDWGELDEEDKQENAFSVDKHLRIVSAYRLATGAKVWVISEADRSATTILCPDEY